MLDTSFYHKCWLLLKATYPHYRIDMDAIELEAAGFNEVSKEKKEDSGNTEPLGQVM